MSDYKISYAFDTSIGSSAAPGDAADERCIEFLCAPELVNHIPAPDKAVRFVPDWFKRLDREMGIMDAHGLPGLTAKACLPMTDAFSLGFIIPLPFDLRIMVPEDRVSIKMGWAEDAPFQPVEQHHPGQIGAPKPPFERTMPLKFINPWRIVVPDGYSVLFMHPLNRPDLPYTCFSGFVDCDRLETTVNFPFSWTGEPGDHVLPAGTPIAQLVPIPRSGIMKKHHSRCSTENELAAQSQAANRKYGEESTYAREWRVKK